MKTFEQILSTPQMLLMALAYRLLGKRYSYTFGQNGIRAIDEVTPKERAFVLLFPMMLFGISGIILATIWLVTYFYLDFPQNLIAYYLDVSLLWHQLFWWLSLLCIGYASMSVLDLPYIYKLLKKKQSHNYPNNGSERQNTGNNHH